jgi:prepilin-type N-terminal cleavage/methylation domain-containing protein/prepilin-type processing-associated H-X9-DG protein
MKRTLSDRRGFTLIELLVVMALLAILSAMLFPVLALAREQARRAVCISRVRQIGQAHLLYLQDWDDRFPSWIQAGEPRPAPFKSRRYWTELLQPYLRQSQIVREPGVSWSGTPEEGVRLADYALLTWGPGGSGMADDPYFRWADPGLTLAQVTRPTETIRLTDGFTTTELTFGLTLRHRGGTNAVFLDGHAGWLAISELRRVDTDGQGFYWRHYAAADR